MQIPPNSTYLGDGLYARHDGYQFVLMTERDDGVHYVALEPEVLMAFIRCVEKVCRVTILIQPNPKPQAEEPEAARSKNDDIPF